MCRKEKGNFQFSARLKEIEDPSLYKSEVKLRNIISLSTAKKNADHGHVVLSLEFLYVMVNKSL